ncbi:MAG TPA: hypothetical protein VF104_00040 [Burkholderiales bacterium]
MPWMLAAALALPAAAGAEAKAPRPAQSAGRYHLVTIKDQDGKELLVRMDKESGATWVLRYGEYPPAPKGPVHYWLSVPCARGDTLAPCAQK